MYVCFFLDVTIIYILAYAIIHAFLKLSWNPIFIKNGFLKKLIVREKYYSKFNISCTLGLKIQIHPHRFFEKNRTCRLFGQWPIVVSYVVQQWGLCKSLLNLLRFFLQMNFASKRLKLKYGSIKTTSIVKF